MPVMSELQRFPTLLEVSMLCWSRERLRGVRPDPAALGGALGIRRGVCSPAPL